MEFISAKFAVDWSIENEVLEKRKGYVAGISVFAASLSISPFCWTIKIALIAYVS